MPEIEKVITVVAEWVKKAENDLKNATFTLEMDDECPTDTVCFHAQQVVEKYLKALLVFKGIPFPKTHNIEDIIALLPPGSRPKLTEKEQDKLTEYATVARYPGDYEPIPPRRGEEGCSSCSPREKADKKASAEAGPVQQKIIKTD